jgi:EAL and modified HD-GYP domain-containing signal transduction protein
VKLFQGFWFAKPRWCSHHHPPFAGHHHPAHQPGAPAGQHGEIEDLLKKDPTLSFNLLRFINSSGFGLSCEITSFRHAVMILGLKKLFRWAALLTTSRDGAPPAVGQTAVVRGRLMELLAPNCCPRRMRQRLRGGCVLAARHHAGHAAGKSPRIGGPAPAGDRCPAARHRRVRALPGADQGLRIGDDAAFARVADELHLSNHQVNWAHLQALAWADSLNGD